MTLLEARQNYNLSQMQAASALGVPLRTYIRYEKDNEYGNALKRDAMIEALDERFKITETKGLLTLEQIKSKLKKLFDEKYNGDELTFLWKGAAYDDDFSLQDRLNIIGDFHLL